MMVLGKELCHNLLSLRLSMKRKKIKAMTLKEKSPSRSLAIKGYSQTLKDVVLLLESSRNAAAKSINYIITTTYWEIGRKIVLLEQHGKSRAAYGEKIIDTLASDLTKQFGRGFGRRNIFQMRAFYLAFPKVQTASAQSQSTHRFPLPWSHYVRLLSVNDPFARDFYLKEALRCGWSFRQLDRQISSLFYERAALSKNKSKILKKSKKSQLSDKMSSEESIKDPFVLEFLSLKDEYSESDLEEALVTHLESFLLELGSDFAFVGRQRRLRIGDEWYRVDLVFFHRRLKCLVIIDLKIGKLTHADAGQMHLYLNYAREHWMLAGEGPPVGLILCAEKDEMVAKYALEGLSNKVMAAQYRTNLPQEKKLIAELEKTRKLLEIKASKHRK